MSSTFSQLEENKKVRRSSLNEDYGYSFFEVIINTFKNRTWQFIHDCFDRFISITGQPFHTLVA